MEKRIMTIKQPVDFIIITALKEEFAAVLAKLFATIKIDDAQYFVEIATNRVVVGCLGVSERRMGHPIAAIKTTSWVKRWQPRYVLSVGIAAGVTDKYPISLGDIIIPKTIANASIKTVTDESSEPDWKFHTTSNILFGKCNLSNWHKYIDKPRPQSEQANPQCYPCGTIVSSNEKVNAPNLVKSYKEKYFDLVGIEMECGGIAIALEEEEKESGKNIEFLTIRAISDFGGGNKGAEQKKWESYAYDAAASYTFAFLENFAAPLQVPSYSYANGLKPSKETRELLPYLPNLTEQEDELIDAIRSWNYHNLDENDKHRPLLCLMCGSTDDNGKLIERLNKYLSALLNFQSCTKPETYFDSEELIKEIELNSKKFHLVSDLQQEIWRRLSHEIIFSYAANRHYTD